MNPSPVVEPASEFLGLPLWGGTTDAFVDWLAPGDNEPRGAARGAAYLNAHTVNLAFRDATYREAIRAADLVYADGMAVVWAARARGLRIAERVNAADFLVAFAQRAIRDGWRVAFVGGRPGEASAAADRLGRHAEGFACCLARDGYYGRDEEPALADALAEARPDVVLLGMGSPRQEAAMLRLRADPRLAGASFWCVGALFEYYAGSRRRAPAWMRRAGLEWFVRLCLEPGRLWRRYLLGNAAFLWRVARGRPAPGTATAGREKRKSDG